MDLKVRGWNVQDDVEKAGTDNSIEFSAKSNPNLHELGTHRRGRSLRSLHRRDSIIVEKPTVPSDFIKYSGEL